MKPIGMYHITDATAPESAFHISLPFMKALGFEHVAAGTEKVADSDFVKICDKIGLRIDHIHLTGDKTNAIWQEGALGDEVVERYCREITTLTNLGIHRGVAHETWGHPEMPVNDLGIERLGRIIRHAEKEKFVIGFENSITPDKHLRAVLDGFQSESAMFTFDTGHWNAFAPKSNFPFDYADRLYITHMQDNDGTGDQHRIPFDGTVDYEKLVPVLKHARCLTFECAKRQKNADLYGDLTYFEHIERLHHAAVRMAKLVGD